MKQGTIIRVLSGTALAVLIGVGYQYITDNKVDNSAAPELTAQGHDTAADSIAVVDMDKATAKSNLESKQSNTSGNTVETSSTAKEQPFEMKLSTWEAKGFDEEWCSPHHQLTQNESSLVKAEKQDWDTFLGKGTAKADGLEHFSSDNFTNNHLVASYESMSAEQLRTLSEEGDKWAKVTFMQKAMPNDPVLNKFAKELMIEGASHQPIKYYVIKFLLDARTGLKMLNNSSPEEQQQIKARATNLVLTSLAHAYSGVEQYDTVGMNMFMVMMQQEPFSNHLPLDQVLASDNAEQKVTDQLARLNKWLKEQRQEANVVLPEPPASVRKSFASDAAYLELIYPENLKLVRQLNISAGKAIEQTACTDKLAHDANEYKRRSEYIKSLANKQNEQ